MVLSPAVCRPQRNAGEGRLVTTYPFHHTAEGLAADCALVLGTVGGFVYSGHKRPAGA